MKLEVTLPARPNSIPVVSTSALNSQVIPQLILGIPADNTSTPIIPPCSTLYLSNGHSLLAHTLQKEGNILQLRPHSLYQHISQPSCQWKFTSWMPLRALLQHCGGQRSSKGDLDAVTVQVVSVYMDFIASDRVFTVAGNPSAVLASLETPVPNYTIATANISTASLLPAPIHTLSQAGHRLPHIFPVAISKVPEEKDLLQLFVHSAAPPQQLFLISQHFYPDPQLLYTDVETGSQVWTLLIAREKQSLQLGMTAWRTTSCTYCAPELHNFSLLLEVSEVGKEMLLLDARASLLGGNKQIFGGEY